jgi:hypothetical protein
MSKAIKTAVAKWGVGLYLEEESTGDTGFTPPTMPQTTSKPVMADGPPLGGMPAQKNPQITSVGPSMDGPSIGPPVMETKKEIKGPPIGGGITSPPASNTNQPPMFTVDNGGTKSPDVSGFDLPTSGGLEKITDVQRVAIETIMSVHGIGFNDLLSKALQRADNLPTSLENIAYLDAVKIIQFGNELRQI